MLLGRSNEMVNNKQKLISILIAHAGFASWGPSLFQFIKVNAVLLDEKETYFLRNIH